MPLNPPPSYPKSSDQICPPSAPMSKGKIRTPNATLSRNMRYRMCFYCENDIDILIDKFYTIGREMPKKDLSKVTYPEVKFFHPQCFKLIAGDEYL